MPLGSFERNPLNLQTGPFGSFFPSASAGNLVLLTLSLFSLSHSNGGNHREGVSHVLQVMLALWGVVTKSALQVLIGPSPMAQWEVPIGASKASSRSHRWFWGQRICQQVHQGAGRFLSAPNSHARKTKFHRNVDHLWMRVTFQERPLERGTKKAKTFVLREQDRNGITGSAQQHKM